MAHGNVPGPSAPSITSASLSALKKDGAHRPLERLCVACWLLLSEDMTRYLRLWGFGTITGCEVIVHAIRRWLQEHNNDGRTVPLDHGLGVRFQPDRPASLRKVRRVAPDSARYCDFVPPERQLRLVVQKCDHLRLLLFASQKDEHRLKPSTARWT